MNLGKITEYTGETRLRAPLERALSAALVQPNPIQTNHRRTLLPLRIDSTGSADSPDGSRLTTTSFVNAVAKIYHRRTGLRRIRDSLKRIVGHSPARREYRAIERLAAIGMETATPLAWGRTALGEEFVVTRFAVGVPLADHIATLEDAQRELAAEGLAACLDRLHNAGHCHGDLHLGNLLHSAAGVVFLDPQRMRRIHTRADRLADWAQLDASLEQTARRRQIHPEECERLDRFRHALRHASGLAKEIDGARLRFDRDHQRGRARRVLRVGRRWQKLRLAPDLLGLAESTLDPRPLEEWLTEGEAKSAPHLIRRGGRVRIDFTRWNGTSVVVKRVDAGGIGRGLADRFRGSAGARAFHAGQASTLLADDSARPLAYFERRRWGLPIASWSWMEAVGDADLDQFLLDRMGRGDDPAGILRIAEALGAWLADAHARGFRHGDLKANNIRVSVKPERLRFWCIDLEDLRRRAPVLHAERVEALAQLNASLADDLVPAPTRRIFLEAYARRYPFERPLEEVIRAVARRSLARGHRWAGRDCEYA